MSVFDQILPADIDGEEKLMMPDQFVFEQLDQNYDDFPSNSGLDFMNLDHTGVKASTQPSEYLEFPDYQDTKIEDTKYLFLVKERETYTQPEESILQ